MSLGKYLERWEAIDTKDLCGACDLMDRWTLSKFTKKSLSIDDAKDMCGGSFYFLSRHVFDVWWISWDDRSCMTWTTFLQSSSLIMLHIYRHKFSINEIPFLLHLIPSLEMASVVIMNLLICSCFISLVCAETNKLLSCYLSHKTFYILFRKRRIFNCCVVEC